MKIGEQFLSWLGKLRYSYTENVYLVCLPFEKPDIKTKDFFINEVVAFLKTKDKIVEGDFISNFEKGETFYLFMTNKFTPFFIPLFHEVYAYTKLKDLKKFSYKYETLIFKNTTILKFKVKCYGKK